MQCLAGTACVLTPAEIGDLFVFRTLRLAWTTQKDTIPQISKFGLKVWFRVEYLYEILGSAPHTPKQNRI